MDDHSVMLEHTLVLAGEVVDSGMVWQGWPCMKQFSLDVHRRSVRTHLDNLADLRMAKREQTKKDEEMTIATLCWPFTACCSSGVDSYEYDRLSLLEEATNSNSHTTSFTSSDNNIEIGISHGSDRNLQHLKERSNSFLVQIQSELETLTNDNSSINSSNNSNSNNNNNYNKSIKNGVGTAAGELVRIQAVSLQPLGSSTPLLSVKKGYKEKKESYGSNN